MFDAPDPADYGLVMPFVVCESVGGPYEDRAFVAGVRYGQIAAEVAELKPGHAWSWTVETPLVRQLDLLAMHEGLTMTAEPWDEHPDEWVHVILVRSQSVESDKES
jgi:hypothetical protein